jgi:hypothetical protein
MTDIRKELQQIRAGAVDGRVPIVDVEELGDEIAELVEKAHAAPGAQLRERFTRGERDVLQALPYAIMAHLLKRVECRLLDIEARAPASVQPAAAPAFDVGPLADAIVKATKEYIDQRFAELAAAAK